MTACVDCWQAITWVTAVCGADQDGPESPTTATASRPRQGDDSMDRRPRSVDAFRSSSGGHRRLSRRGSSEDCRGDRSTDAEQSPPLTPSTPPSRRKTRTKSRDCDADDYRSDEKPLVFLRLCGMKRFIRLIPTV